VATGWAIDARLVPKTAGRGAIVLRVALVGEGHASWRRGTIECRGARIEHAVAGGWPVLTGATIPTVTLLYS